MAKASEKKVDGNKVEENKVAEVSTELVDTENTDSIKIANDVIAVIAGVAVSEISGVAGMAGNFAGGITEALSGRKNLAKGIKVESTDKTAKIDVNIIVEYGTRIPEVAFEIQSSVKKAVETMTGLKVTAVNISVQGVTSINEKEDEEVKKEDEEN
jgi:uncharacterized alkaline shock family protein YloU